MTQPNKWQTFSVMEKDELLDIKRFINLLHSEIHNPGAAEYITGGKFNLDRDTDEIVYLLDHAIKNCR